MGGSGSNRWQAHKRKQLVEETPRLDFLAPALRALLSADEAAEGVLSLGSGKQDPRWEFRLDGRRAGRGRRELRLRGPAGETILRLAKRRVGFSERIYPVCPGCEGTARILYALPAGNLACRRCAGLTYRSVQQHDARVDRLRAALRRMEAEEVERALPGLGAGSYRGLVASRLLLSALLQAKI